MKGIGRALFALGAFALVPSLLLAGAASAAERLYVTSSYADMVNVVDVASRTVVAGIEMPGEPFAIVAAPDGTAVYAGTDAGITIIDTHDNSVAATIALDAEVWSLGISRDGRTLYVATRWFLYFVIDTATHVVREVPFDAVTTAVLPSPDGASLYVLHEPRALHPQSSFTVVDAQTFEVVREVSFLGIPALAVDPRDGALLTLAITPSGGDLIYLRARTGTLRERLALEVGYGWPAFTPGGDEIVIWGDDELALLDAKTGELLRTITPAGQRDIAVSPSGLLYSLSSEYSSVFVFDPSDPGPGSPLVATIPLPVQVEKMALAEVPQSSTSSADGGCSVSPRSSSSPSAWFAVALLLPALFRRRLGSARGG